MDRTLKHRYAAWQPVEELRFGESEALAEPFFSVFAAQRELRPPFFNRLLSDICSIKNHSSREILNEHFKDVSSFT